MFFWVEINLESHHRFEVMTHEEPVSSVVHKLMDALWDKLLQSRVLVVPGRAFTVPKIELRQDGQATGVETSVSDKHLRLSFAHAEVSK